MSFDMQQFKEEVKAIYEQHLEFHRETMEQLTDSVFSAIDVLDCGFGLEDAGRIPNADSVMDLTLSDFHTLICGM